MKRVLVTGSGGQLGRSLQDLSGQYPDCEFHFFGRDQLDITQEDNVRNVFQEISPHYCINGAAYTKVDLAEKHPQQARAVNVMGVENLIRACREAQCVLIHISTDYVFDGKKAEGYTAADPTNPINVYGKTKREGEELIERDMQRYFIIRTSWLYSKKYPPNFYLTILGKAQNGENLTVTDAQKGCPTDAANLARHILDLIKEESNRYGISHFTDGEAMTWYGFATRILQEHGLNGRIELRRGDTYASLAARPENSVLLG